MPLTSLPASAEPCLSGKIVDFGHRFAIRRQNGFSFKLIAWLEWADRLVAGLSLRLPDRAPGSAIPRRREEAGSATDRSDRRGPDGALWRKVSRSPSPGLKRHWTNPQP